MIYRKKKVKKPEEIKSNVNAWELIKGNLSIINNTCDFIKKSLNNLTADTNMVKERYKSQTAKENEMINNISANLKSTASNLKKVRIISDSIKSELGLENTIFLPGLPVKLPN